MDSHLRTADGPSRALVPYDAIVLASASSRETRPLSKTNSLSNIDGVLDKRGADLGIPIAE